MKYLRQSTATTVIVGPFLAKADGLTPVTTLTSASTLNGRAVSNATGAAYVPATFTHDANGEYLAPLAATDIPSVGQFRLGFSDPTTYCPVWEDCAVLSAPVYDSLFGASALSTFAGGAVASVTSGVTVATNNDKLGYTLVQAFPANFATLGITAAGKLSEVVLVDTLTTYTGNVPQTGDSFARIGTPTGASIAADIQTRSTYAGGAVASVAGSVGSVVAAVTLAAGSSPAQGLAVAGSTASAVIVSGLAASLSFAGQRLYNQGTGEARTISGQSYAAPNYTFTFGAGTGEAGPFSLAPVTGVGMIPVP